MISTCPTWEQNRCNHTSLNNRDSDPTKDTKSHQCYEHSTEGCYHSFFQLTSTQCRHALHSTHCIHHKNWGLFISLFNSLHKIIMVLYKTRNQVTSYHFFTTFSLHFTLYSNTSHALFGILYHEPTSQNQGNDVQLPATCWQTKSNRTFLQLRMVMMVTSQNQHHAMQNKQSISLFHHFFTSFHFVFDYFTCSFWHFVSWTDLTKSG